MATTTSYDLKGAYERASAAADNMPKAGGTFTGAVNFNSLAYFNARSAFSGGYEFYNGNGDKGYFGGPVQDNQFNSVSLWAAAAVRATELQAYSDRRIKRNIRKADPIQDIATLASLKVHIYDMIHGGKNMHGFIGQEILEDYSEASNVGSGEVYDCIQQVENVESTEENNVKLYLENTSLFKVDRSIGIVTKAGEMHTDYVKHDVKVLEVGDTYIVVEHFPWEGKLVKIVSRIVDDFHFVTMERIIPLLVNVCQYQESRIAKLEKQVNDLLSVLNSRD
jgi:hypothetical protein